MSTPEGKVKTFISNYMKKNFPDAFKYCPPSGRFGRAGLPDFIYLIDGVFVGIEAKADNGYVTDLQLNTLNRLKTCGAVVAIVRGKDVQKMESIRDEILRRIRLADEGQE